MMLPLPGISWVVLQQPWVKRMPDPAMLPIDEGTNRVRMNDIGLVKRIYMKK
jgi:hypothetical protein